MLIVSNLEMDITHVCNLHCPGCSHYADYALRNQTPLAEGGDWLRVLARTVTPRTFSILGGEPSLHPDAAGYLRLVRDLWPGVRLVMVSNGIPLPRRPELVEAVAETGTQLQISIHSYTDPVYVERFHQSMAWLAERARRTDLDIVFRKTQSAFYRTYLGRGSSMRPHDHGDPRAAWEACANRACATVHQGRIWKCPPIAFLGLVAEKFGLGDDPAWGPYLAYRGIPVDAPAGEIAAFLSREEEDICGMCPTRLDTAPLGIVTRPYRDGEP